MVTYSIVATSLIAFVIVPWVDSWGDTPSLASQLESIRSAAEEEGFETIADQAVDLKATGQKSHLFVFRKTALRRFRFERNLSDEIRLYTEEDGRLSPSFRFRPENSLGGPVLFQLTDVQDLDGNGRPEILGSFSPKAVDALEAFPLPVVITWDDKAREFEMYPLNSRAPQLTHLKHVGFYAQSVREGYRQPVVLKDSEHGLSVRGFPVAGFAVAQTPLEQPAVLEAYVGRAACHFCEQALEVRLHTARYQAPPETFPCAALPRDSRQFGVLASLRGKEWAILRPSRFLSQEAKRLEHRFECIS